jgi:hypothetical protein
MSCVSFLIITSCNQLLILESISGPIDDGQGDAIVFGVFQTSRSSVLMSAVCSFRMSQVVSAFDHGRFKVSP